jgi:hypothetical protein
VNTVKAKPGSPKKGSAWQAFWRGATRASAAGLGGTLLVAAACFACCVWFITPDFIAAKGRYLVVDREDEYAALTAQVMRIARTEAPCYRAVVVGDSAVREALSSPGDIQRALNEKLQKKVRVDLLTTGGLTPWEALMALDVMGDRFDGGLVVLQMAPQLLANGPDMPRSLCTTPRVALSSAAFDRELRIWELAPPERTGNYFLDNYKFFAARPQAILNVARGPRELPPHMAESWRPPAAVEWQRAVNNMVRWRDGYAANREANLGLYRRLIGDLQARSIQVALAEDIINPRAEAAIKEIPEVWELLEQYGQDVAELARGSGVAHWNLRDEAGLVPEDFLDHTHLRNPAARQRYTDVLSQHLALLAASRPPKKEDKP